MEPGRWDYTALVFVSPQPNPSPLPLHFASFATQEANDPNLTNQMFPLSSARVTGLGQAHSSKGTTQVPLKYLVCGFWEGEDLCSCGGVGSKEDESLTLPVT